MRNKYVGVGLLVLTLGLACAIGRAAETAAAPFLGKWSITLQDVSDSFRVCWLEVTRNPDGSLGGSLLWRYGSVAPIKSAKVENGELQVVRAEYDDRTKKSVDCTYAMKLKDDKLEGSVKQPDGKAYRFTGVRAIEKVDIAGTWNLAVFERQGRKEDRTLVLQQDGEKIAGTFSGAGLSVPVESANLAGNKLSFSVNWGRPTPITAEFKGDKVSGTIRLPFTGERQRKTGPEVVLFGGKDLKGWHSREAGEVPPKWEIKDGYMIPLKGASDIVSDQKFDDFKLHVEFCLPEKGGNSGVYPRGLYEVQALDDFGKGLDPHGCGAVYSRIAPTKNASKPVGEWQTLDITLVGRWITVVLNGEMVVDNQHIDGITGGALVGDENEPGPVMLQAHGEAVRFRNVRLTPFLK